MDEQRLARLTDQQRVCLRLVYAHMTSKEIAPLLGIEPGSVDQHLKAAMRTLGVGDRRSAARLLHEHEGGNAPQPLVYQPPDVAGTAAFPASEAQIESVRKQRGSVGEAVREDQRVFQAASPAGAPTLPLPIGRGRPSDLGWVARLGWIVVIAIGIALAFGALVSGVEALVRLTKG